MEIYSINVKKEKDILSARDRARVICEELGFQVTNQLQVTTSVFELGKNILEHGKGGRITFSLQTEGDDIDLVIEGQDNGPGMTDDDIKDLLAGKKSSAANRGVPAMKRLMDSIEIDSDPGDGTNIRLTKRKAAQQKSIASNIVSFFQQKVSGRESPSLSQELRIQNQNLVQTLSLFEEKNEELANANQELLDFKKQLEESNNELQERTAELQEALLNLGDRTTELEAQNRRFTAVLQQMREGVVITDRSGVVVNANKQFCNRISTEEKKLVGLTKTEWQNFLDKHHTLADKEWTQFQKELEAAPTEAHTLTLTTHDEKCTVTCRITPLLDGDNKFNGRLWFFE